MGGLSRSSILGILSALAALLWLVLRTQEPDEPVVEAPPAPPVEDVAEVPTVPMAVVDEARIAQIETGEPGAWLTYGRNYEEQRFSPLTAINRETVGTLSLAWHKSLDTIHKVEATPLVIDGVMYVTAPFNIVYALDAATGEELWRFDPEVPGETARLACCGVVSRGLAAYKGRIYSATLDGRLIALDAATGRKFWEVDTIIDRTRDYTITGAPRAAAGKVFIGNGGAEYGVRGYVTAYDAATGDQVWRFFTVPGNPAEPFEHPEMELAAGTWKGGNWWEIGGGGTVWNAIVYDPDLHTLYIGVGNGAPWSRIIRSPGGGDNLFLASIVALDPDTGAMKWYYQTVPGDNWDYTAVQDIMLADLTVDGERHKVLMQAPKNGFFYVIDRENGQLLRAHPFATVTWASHVDLETGRPVENLEANYDRDPKRVLPGPGGAHNWQAMSWDAGRGLMYFPSHDLPGLYMLSDDYKQTGIYKRVPRRWNTGMEEANRSRIWEQMPDHQSLERKGFLIAFDPLTGETRWSAPQSGSSSGALATAGGLVFHGDSDGNLAAYDSDTGGRLWAQQMYTGILAPPITYEVDGVQYVSILTGAASGAAGEKYGSHGRVAVFKLGGGDTLPVPPELDRSIPRQPPLIAAEEDIDRGRVLYAEICRTCHGFNVRGGGGIPDLRQMTPETHQAFAAIVLGGSKRANGLASFADLLTAEDAERVHQYIIARATEDREASLAEATSAAEL
jgi:quinohemoprotein ethanol dehydrogenase